MQDGFARIWMVACILCLGCAHIPKESYGISKLSLRGMEALDSGALRACLVTEQRNRLTLGLTGLRNPECGQPPFDRARIATDLFAWPWTTWPLYDEAVFRLDLSRIERWYQARGYYGVRIDEITFDPGGAEHSDLAACGERGCPLDITVTIVEGEPVRITALHWEGLQDLPAPVRRRVQKLDGIKVTDIFDEARYDSMRLRAAKTLGDAGYARARVRGNVLIDQERNTAEVTLYVEAGNVCRVGSVRVESRTAVPHGPILAAASLKSGALYDEDALEDAQRAIYALGAFSAVTVRGERDKPGDVIDIVLEVEPRRESQWTVGGGMMNGVLTTGIIAPEWMSVPQWDLHLTGSFEHRNFYGGLRRLRIENRPRMLFLGAFPEVPSDSPRFGNIFRVDFSQPGVIEARTLLRAQVYWDNGPDPFLLFFRNTFGASVGGERGFLKQRLLFAAAVHQEFMLVAGRQPIVDNAPSSYELPFLEQRVSLDLRNDAANPDYGAYFSLSAQEAFKVTSRGWNYLRLTPDARGYLPLGLGIVLAGRFALGWMHIFKAGSGLDTESQELGPQAYRFRGGGAQSNRGFAPGLLGDGIQGGIRRWESSVELRVPFTQSFSIALFCDMGDVHAGSSFRFTHLNTAFGGGIRYRTLVGPIRFDVGIRPQALQRLGGGEGSTDTTKFLGKRFEGAVHITIGEPF